MVASVAILIPAYQPSKKLLQIVDDVAARISGHFVVVNDGSDREHDAIFHDLETRADVTVLRHGANMGKGQALKTGINHILVAHQEACTIVTADADGQHLPDDIVSVVKQAKEHPEALILGTREFTSHVPFRSRLGNVLTNAVFRTVMKCNIKDTQTGLRGLPRAYAESLLCIDSNGYEFEFEALTMACRDKVDLVEIPIETIYEEGNKCSHFNPISDSAKIYFVFSRFVAASVFISILDMAAFSLVFFFSDHLFWSMVAGRVCAGITQFMTSKLFVFNSKKEFFGELIRYASLVLALMTTSYFLIASLSAAGANTYFAKVIIDTLLFLCSFIVQRTFVFKSRDKVLK